MAALSISTIARTGINCTTGDVAASAGGDTIANTGVEFLYANNADASSTTLTFEITVTPDGQDVTDRTLVVPANTVMVAGPFPTATYGATVNITYSSVTSLTVLALKPGT